MPTRDITFLAALALIVILLILFLTFQIYKFNLSAQALRDWSRDQLYRQHLPPDISTLYEIIQKAQEDAGIQLTWGAREMLSIPVIELVNSPGQVNWNEITTSIRDVVQSAAEYKAPRGMSKHWRDSIAIIRGFHTHFCNVPPFCSRREV